METYRHLLQINAARHGWNIVDTLHMKGSGARGLPLEASSTFQDMCADAGATAPRGYPIRVGSSARLFRILDLESAGMRRRTHVFFH